MFGSVLTRDTEMEEDDGFILVSVDDCDGTSETALSSRVNNNDGSKKYLSEIDRYVDSLAASLWPLNKFIHENPELAFKEYKAHNVLTFFMESQDGWKVTRSACGIETAWIAAYDTGKPGPIVSFNVEMDALPNLGHACGHNLIATASLAAGLSTAHLLTLHSLPGKVLILGTPGEEGTTGGKILLLNSGAYSATDITLISHPGILNNSPMVRTTAFTRLEVSYHGVPSHAANSPWKGINALDALILAYNSISVLRQQTRPTDIISMSITDGGGNATNVIHPFASGVCTVRAASTSNLTTLTSKITACFHAASLATGAKVTIKTIPGYQDHVPNVVLAKSYRKYWTSLPDIPPPSIPPEGQFTFVKASTDQGNLSHVIPSINASFAIPPGPQKGQPHSADFEKASGRREAFDVALSVGKALAGTAVDVFTKEGMLEEVKRRWRRDMEEMG